MKNFREIFERYEWDEVRKKILGKGITDVEHALKKQIRTTEDFMALVSPAASAFLEEMAQISRDLTLRRFGKTIQMFAPLYLSNECNNICTYCGYSFGNKIVRKTLTDEEILKEAIAVRELGFEHVLLVSGEANASVNLDYFMRAIKIIKPYFSNISVEFQPLDENEYTALHEAGVHAVLVYQETYDKEAYKVFHPKGKKSNFWYRLETPERTGRSGMHKTGLGILSGLSDWRTDAFFCALHLDFLRRTFWKSKFSISFPRIRPAEGVEFAGPHISDRELLQLIFAYRLFDPDAELSISTREAPLFRDNIIRLGITSMSAGSRTNPGGYAVDSTSLEQFETDDNRSPDQVKEMIASQGYEPVMKDWDKVYS